MGKTRFNVLLGASAWLASSVQAAETTVTATGLDQHDGELLELGYPDPRIEGDFEVLDLAFIENGTATIRTAIEDPFVAQVRLVDGDESFARGVVEPGAQHQVAAGESDGNLRLSGGTYNELIFPTPTATPSDSEVDAHLKDIYLNHGDSTARVLALQAAWLEGDDDEQNATFAELSGVLGDYRAVDLMTALRDQRTEQIAKTMKYFSALTLDGEEVRLEDVLKDNEYTLVEFWASWCGPCIAEIPYLKSAYEKYRDKGFEILSVNLDEDPAAWETASVEDYDIPWVNVCDGEAFDSTIAKLYRVKAIPANYLITSDGKRVARHLRGESLEAKLAELLPL
ncbi:MAG: thioredoxin-like domain-containing protein [Gammaproteobacteria bacterium]|nr:thioredoxin-like domain-containing protein [Gammaproteobacteria bacterium]